MGLPWNNSDCKEDGKETQGKKTLDIEDFVNFKKVSVYARLYLWKKMYLFGSSLFNQTVL